MVKRSFIIIAALVLAAATARGGAAGIRYHTRAHGNTGKRNSRAG